MPALRTLPRFTKALVMRNTLTLHPRLSTAALAMALLAPIASQAEAQKIQFDIGAQSLPSALPPVRPAEPVAGALQRR